MQYAPDPVSSCSIYPRLRRHRSEPTLAISRYAPNPSIPRINYRGQRQSKLRTRNSHAESKIATLDSADALSLGTPVRKGDRPCTKQVSYPRIGTCFLIHLRAYDCPVSRSRTRYMGPRSAMQLPTLLLFTHLVHHLSISQLLLPKPMAELRVSSPLHLGSPPPHLLLLAMTFRRMTFRIPLSSAIRPIRVDLGSISFVHETREPLTTPLPAGLYGSWTSSGNQRLIT